VGKVSAAIDESVRQFIQGQHVFFVGSAPIDVDVHINLSPKGLDTFRILGPTTVAYLDLTGSGIETVAHLKENGRITLMFCAFQGPPNILRLYGKGRAVEPGQAEFAELVCQFPDYNGIRTVIVVEIFRIANSCGYAVPLLRYEGERTQLTAWAGKKGVEGLKTYRAQKNHESIDGLPGLPATE
jgi:pyridoxamine 5'-phosphate oxidase-like protein